MSRIEYEMIRENQINLTEQEEIELTYKYKEAKDTLHECVAAQYAPFKWFIRKYESVKAEGKSLAKLSADYNPREKGKNTDIELRFQYMMDPDGGITYTQKEVIRGINPSTQKEVIRGINPSAECWTEMIKVSSKSKRITNALEEMLRIETILMCSMLMAAKEIAKNNSSRILSIDEADATQEVNLYLLESIRKYDPDYRTTQGKRVKLCTYAYGRSENLLKEWILSNSRLVRVPRSKMERILIVVRAHDSLQHNQINLFTLTVKSNTILKERKGKLQARDIFDIDEVDGLIKILMSNNIHIDQPYNRNQGVGGSRTIGDMLSSKQPTPIDKLEEKQTREQLLTSVKEALTDTEFQVIMLRYFHNPTDKVPKALADVGALLTSEYGGKEYSRETIRLLEKSALSKLKGMKEVQELWIS